MGRMKDLLGDSLPTIGDSRRQGMTKFDVRCPAPCGRIATVTFDATGLPDDTAFLDIPKKVRLRCSSCDRIAREVEANWSEYVAAGNGRRPAASWIVVARMPDGTETRSSVVASEERAMGLAFDLADRGDVVLRIEGPGGDVSGEAIEAAREARRRRL